MWFLTVVGGALVLGLAIAYGFIQYYRRDRSKDAMTEAATAAQYHTDGTFDRAENTHPPRNLP